MESEEQEQPLESLEIDRDQLAVCSVCGLTGKFIDIVAHADGCAAAAASPSKLNSVKNAEKQHAQVVNSAAKHGNRSDRGDETFIWPPDAVSHLIQLFEQHQNMFNSPRYTKKRVWEKLSSIMNERGYNVTGLQVDNKWKFLKRHYLKIKCSPNSAQRQSWPFFEAMDQLALDVNLDSNRTIDVSEESANQAETDSLALKFVHTSPPKKRKLNDVEPAWIKTLRLDMNRREQMAQKRHDEFIKVQRDNQLMFKEMMEKFISVIKK